MNESELLSKLKGLEKKMFQKMLKSKKTKIVEINHFKTKVTYTDGTEFRTFDEKRELKLRKYKVLFQKL